MIVPPIGSNPGPGGGGQPAGSTKKKGTTPAPKKPKAPAAPKLYRQPIFDKRIRTLTWPMQGGLGTVEQQDFGTMELVRGIMVWDKAKPYTEKPEVNFLFNPTTVSASYSMDATDVSASLQFRSPQDTAAAVFAANQSISISLYFDRTFELWGSYDPSTGQPRAKQKAITSGNTTYYQYDVMDPSVYGVNVDILAFKQITGQLLQQYSINGSTGAAAPSASGYIPGISEQGVMTMTPTWLFLGPMDTGMSYYGYISDFSVTVTHFTQYMVPMRCIIDVDFALLIPPGNEPLGPSFVDWMLLAEMAQDAPASPGSTAGKAGR